MDKLDDSNILLYAAKHYDNPVVNDTVEFYEDFNRFKYIKRLLNKYKETGDLKERLILNHIVVLQNVFGVIPATRMLFLKCKGYEHLFKPFLVLLDTTLDTIENIGVDNQTINFADITMDINIVEILRKSILPKKDSTI